jgi:Flp pilus assembly pilin Flp
MADISGATAIEYAFIGTGIATVIIGAMFAIGDEMAEMFEMIQTTFEASIE